MSDLIDRQAAIDAINHICPVDTEYDCTLLDRVDVRYVLLDLPAAQPEKPTGERTETHACDSISRQAAIDALKTDMASLDHIIKGMSGYDVRLDAYVSQRNQVDCDIDTINNLPTAQPDLSEAYANAVFTWLMSYQIQSAQLKGRYTPYEVIGWVLNDWRKEHDAERDT